MEVDSLRVLGTKPGPSVRTDTSLYPSPKSISQQIVFHNRSFEGFYTTTLECKQ